MYCQYAETERTVLATTGFAGYRVAAWARRWMCVGAAVLPVAFSSGLQDGYVLPKLVLARVVVVGLFAAWLARCAVCRALVVRRSLADLPVLAFVLSSVFSTLLAENGTLALWGGYTRYESLLTHTTYALLFWLIVQVFETAEHVRGLIRALLVGGSLTSSYAVVQWANVTLSPEGPATDNAFAFDGVARAYSTMGNATLLATLMAMLLPLVVYELRRAGSVVARIIFASALIVMTIALVVTFSRSAWIGAVAGVTVMAAATGHRASLRLLRWSGGAVVTCAAAAAVLASRAPSRPAQGLLPALGDRLLSLVDINGSGGTRLHLWRDTLSAIVRRPLVGYGPDNFGLVYPLYRSGDWTPGHISDKAHSDLLDIAIAQGLIGVVAMGAVAGAVVRTSHRLARTADGQAVALLGGCVAYEAVTMLNFAWVPVTAVAWIMAAGIVAPTGRPSAFRLPGPRWAVVGGLLIPALVVTVTAGVYGVAAPVAADRHYYLALDLAWSDPTRARNEIQQARSLAPYQSAYASAAGDLAFAAADWRAAEEAYRHATVVGATDSETFVSFPRNSVLGERSRAS